MLYLWEMSIGSDDVGNPNIFYVIASDEEADKIKSFEELTCEYDKSEIVHEKLVSVTQNFRSDRVIPAGEIIEEIYEATNDRLKRDNCNPT